jgi:hypothetical protein
VILVQITEDDNVNRHGLLLLCGAHLRCRQWLLVGLHHQTRLVTNQLR